ncbi:MAG: hypothetical protein Q9162_002126 [Coniocarpon cinnabarinum]
MLHKTTSHQHLSPRQSSSERRPKTSGDSKTSFWKRHTHLDGVKRDSGLAPSFESTCKDLTVDGASESKMQSHTSGADLMVPSIALNDTIGGASESPNVQRPRTAPQSSELLQELQQHDALVDSGSSPSEDDNFAPLSTAIETGGFDNPFGGDHLSFSNRGSVLLDGQKAFFDGSRTGSVMTKKSPQLASKSPRLGVPQRSPSSAEKRLSQKVRSMYEGGAILEEAEEKSSVEAETRSVDRADFRQHGKAESTDDANDTVAELPRITSPSHSDLTTHSRNLNSRPGSVRASYIKMEPWEAAGGIEDYHDVRVGDVDRYGFIRPGTGKSQASDVGLTPPANGTALSGRTSNEVDNPFVGSVRNGKLHKPPPTSSRTNRSSFTSARSTRPHSSATSHAASAVTTRSYRSLHLSRPGSSRHRRWANEAPDMLNVPSGMPKSPSGHGTHTDAIKHKTEQRRIDKWEKMAHQLNSIPRQPHAAVGGGQTYSFDTKSPKLIERVWKGVPDVWRAPAWHAFLIDSAKTHHKSDYVHDHELVRRYFAHQEQDSLDDIQIDMDVPRTVGQHVMFRARYRGGQRLLFRVLRALSLEYPETGYVQGMAPLAATLLCYFDEEQAFVAACRLWRDRGLAELFAQGFGGLMTALEVFETKWLAENKPVKKQLEELGIPATSYGTKWYLTLFNYALPFEAQLRVWDVFILLGGSASEKPIASASEDDGRFDVLHAVSAAIIDALQDTLIGAEFENAMAALTGSVPVGNEDVLMRVTKREFEERQKRRKKGR